jgi:leader peptidase (prepilin peptidase)/N-methyltransferase
MVTSIILVSIVGVLAGGIVNVLADDLPHRRNPGRPKYPDGTPRPFLAWIGITAFLLGRRAGPDGSKLPWRHPITEIVSSVLMIVTIIATDNNPQIGAIQLLFWLVYMVIFVLVTVIDIEHKLILFVVMIPSAIIALLDAAITPTEVGPNLIDSLAGGVVGFGVFFIMFNGGYLFTYVLGKLRGEEITTVAFGFGDVMMATLSGLILGWQALIFAMFITVFLGAFGAIIYLVTRSLAGQKYSMYTALPYGPYIVIGTFLMLLFSTEIRMLLLGY